MSEVPSRALYKCPQHGVFVVETDGVLWTERSCTVLIGSNGPGIIGYPCGILSPLARLSDPELDGPISGLGDPSQLADLRDSIAKLREQRKQEAAQGRELAEGPGGKQNYGLGGPRNRKNGQPMLAEAQLVDPEQAAFEESERERMRAAISEGWDD
jgi:hypothetical protein